MASNVDICNMALSHCGISSFISSLDEASNEARVCALHLPLVRGAVLQDFPWNFARRRRLLAALAETPPANWAYVYALPEDCLAALFIAVPGMRAPRSDQRIPFEVAANDTQRVLYTDQPSAELVYSANVENPTLFDPLFIQALSFALASAIAAPLSVSSGLVKYAHERYAVAVSQAAAASLRAGEECEPESILVEGRF